MIPQTTVSVEKTEGVVTITLTRPYSLNAAGKQELLTSIRQLANDHEVRALIITAGHPEAFLVDVVELAEMSPSEAAEFSEVGQQISIALTELPIPTISAVDGMALGGGCELAMSCELTYASNRSRLGQIEVMGGVIPGFGGTWKLAHRVGLQRACEMIFSAAVVEAERAKELGLVLEVLPPEDLLPHCRQVATSIAQSGKLAIARAKKALLEGFSLPLSAAMAIEQGAFASLFGTEDQRQRMKAFVQQSGTQKN